MLATGPILPGSTPPWSLPNEQVYSLYGDYLPTGDTSCGNKHRYLIVGLDKRERPALASQANGHQVGEVHKTKRARNKDSKKRQNDAGVIHAGEKTKAVLSRLATYLGTHDMKAHSQAASGRRKDISRSKTTGAGGEKQRGQAAVQVHTFCSILLEGIHK